MFEARIGLSALADLCRRLGTSLSAGIDIRRVFQREGAGRGGLLLSSRLQRVSDALAEGQTLGEALATTGKYFPPLFLDLAEVGEQTGKLPEVLLNLADSYDQQLLVRRSFMRAMILPGLELAGALFVLGVLILVMGWLPSRGGKPIDILGLGLVGESGLLIYVAILAVFFGAIGFFVYSLRRGSLWTSPIQKLLLRLPVFGRFLQLLALSRLAWAMHLTLNTSLGLSKALPLSLRSMQNAHYGQHIEPIVRAVTRGKPLFEAFENTKAFPGDFLDALEVGERSGRLPETMGHLAQQYFGEALRRLNMFAMAGGFAVLMIVIFFIAGMILLIASNTFIPYVNEMYDLINEINGVR